MDQAARILECTRINVQKAIERGRIPAIRRGRDWFILRADVIARRELLRRLGNRKHDPTRDQNPA